MLYNVNMKLEHLLENAQAVQLFDRFLPGVRERVTQSPQSLKLSVEQLIRYTRIPNADALLRGLDAALQALNTPENAVSPAEAKLIARFRAIDAAAREQAPRPAQHRQDCIRPGQPWLDTKGERIQAHGGAVYYEDGVYYWYGENKEHTDGKNGIWTWGIRVYASTDLMNWEDRGLLIPPVLDDPNAALFPTKRVDRPHILRCAATGKYVCWIKLSGPEAAFTVWQADRLLGPYEVVENLYNPGGHKAGDFDLIADEATGKAYLYFDADHSCMLCMELTADYLHAAREVARNYPDLHPPFTREAPALFAARGRCYMLTSGMTGYVPNASDSAAAERWDAVFTSLGDPHADEPDCSSYNSQISKIFRVEGTERFIAMADRWLPDYNVDARRADLFRRVIASNYAPEQYQASEAERREMYAGNVLETADTSHAEYVWLPIEWEGEKPVLRWHDAWKVEDLR
ncbi:MAG: family 43 glycosylhydrolase [Oscillospiraceae bacterium]|nr:family 43 glycosylhydrolase [Oscillospiraceae bacterium]